EPAGSVDVMANSDGLMALDNRKEDQGRFRNSKSEARDSEGEVRSSESEIRNSDGPSLEPQASSVTSGRASLDFQASSVASQIKPRSEIKNPESVAGERSARKILDEMLAPEASSLGTDIRACARAP